MTKDIKLLGLMEMSPEAMFLLDLKYRVILMNSKVEKLFGYSKRELTRQSIRKFLFYPDGSGIRASDDFMKDSHNHDCHVKNEFLCIRSDGTKVPVEIFWGVIRAGKRLMFSVVVTDITKRKRTEFEIKRLNEDLSKKLIEIEDSKTLFEAIFNQTFQFIGLLKPDGTLMEVNQTALDFGNWKKELVIGKKFWEAGWWMLTSLRERNRLKKAIFDAAKGEFIRYELRIPFRGRPYFFDFSIKPVKNQNGEVILLIPEGREITERKLTEVKAELARCHAEDASRAKNEFLANMSHEIRTPLGVILGYSEMLQDSNRTESEKEKYRERIHKSAEHLSLLISDVLDFSKIEAGKLKIEMTSVSIHDLMREIQLQFDDSLKNKGLVYEMHISDNVPRLIMTDRCRLQQLLMNLIGNAVKFTEVGSVSVRIDWRIRNPNMLYVSVKDTGIGICEEERGCLFEPFSRGSKLNTQKYEGTGLGLGLSRRIARAMGGELELVESEVGKGSTFKLSIKGYINKASSASIDNGFVLDDAAKRLMFYGKRILLVEDEKDNQELIRYFLSKVGVQIDLAETGESALERLITSTYDLVLMDLRLPKMSGIEVASEARKSGFKNPIIALTAHATIEERNRCFLSGFDEFLTKPVDPEILFSTLGYFSEKNNDHTPNPHWLK